MNRTQIIGITMIVAGIGTIFYYQRDIKRDNILSIGSLLFFAGALITWNGWVASVNRQPSFALFG